jgi:hypothetical protein
MERTGESVRELKDSINDSRVAFPIFFGCNFGANQMENLVFLDKLRVNLHDSRNGWTLWTGFTQSGAPLGSRFKSSARS